MSSLDGWANGGRWVRMVCRGPAAKLHPRELYLAHLVKSGCLGWFGDTVDADAPFDLFPVGIGRRPMIRKASDPRRIEAELEEAEIFGTPAPPPPKKPHRPGYKVTRTGDHWLYELQCDSCGTNLRLSETSALGAFNAGRRKPNTTLDIRVLSRVPRERW